MDESERKKITLLQNDADKLPFDDNSFDVIYSILVINLIPDFANAFKEINRVIKPGGLFIFSVPFLDSIYFPAGLYVNSRGKTIGANESGYRYSHWFKSEEIKETLETTGFFIENIKGQPPYVRMTDHAKPLTTGLGMLFAKSIYVLAKAK
jgi:ubiquinone/menaquinone biosynthesis C-methylase UbiE